MILELVALSAVIAGDVVVMTTRGRRRGLGGLDKGSTVTLGLGLIGVGLLFGGVSLPSLLGLVAVVAAVLELVFVFGGLVLFLRRQPVQPPDIDPDEVIDRLRDAGFSADELGEARRQLDALGAGSNPDSGGSPEPDGGEEVEGVLVGPDCLLVKGEGDPRINQGSKTDLLLPKSIAWTFLVISDLRQITLVFRVKGEEFSPVTTYVVATTSIGFGAGAIAASGYQFFTGDNPYTSNYEVEEEPIYEIVCDEECEASRRHRAGNRTANDGPLAAEIAPDVREVGNDVRFNPEMLCVLGDEWSFSGSGGVSGMGLSGGVGLSHSSADLASGRKLLGTHVWKCLRPSEIEDSRSSVRIPGREDEFEREESPVNDESSGSEAEREERPQ